MNDSENIKALIPVVCPHCTQTSVVEFVIAASLLDPKAAEEVLKSVEPVIPPAVTPLEEPKVEPTKDPTKDNESEKE